MSDSEQAAAPESGLSDDPEIMALLDFEPVPRKVKLEGGWTPELQRQFIVRLAKHGSPGKAANALGMEVSGVRKLYFSPLGGSFRAAWDRAVELAKQRMAAARPARVAESRAPPSVDGRRNPRSETTSGQLDVNGQPQQPGQVLNEYGEWEDEAAYLRRAEEAKDSIGNKLVRSRRLFLLSISQEPVKRAAFEILTELPVDWELAARHEPQPFEPWHRANAHEPDMVLTAESGWSWGEIGYGPDKKAELRAAINEYRAEQGLPPL